MKQNEIIKRIFMAAIMLLCVNHAFALGKRETVRVQVGQTFTVQSSGHTNLMSILWKWDTGCLDLISNVTQYSTSATFKAKKATPISGVIIQATVYYQASQGTVASGKFFDDWTVHIEDNSTVSLDCNSKTLSPGSTFTLRATPSSSSYSGSYKWTSSNSSVAYFTGFGNSVTVRAGDPGRATIRVTLDNGKYAECYVTVEDNSTVSLSETSRDLSVGGSFTLRATASSGYYGSYSWTTSNSAVASYSGSGSSVTINAKSPGSATIKVALSNGASASCNVTVKDVPVTSVSVSDLRIEAGKSTTASRTIYPSNATVKSTVWNIVSGSDVISVSSTGSVSAKKPGSASISCTVNGSVVSNTAKVTVFEPDLTQTSSTPQANATAVSVFTKPVIEYSHAISKGTAFGQITLDGGGRTIAGSAEISGKRLTFVPSRALQPLTQYTLTVPRNAIKNEWGSPAQKDVSLRFTTADIDKAKVEASPVSDSYLMSNETITLSATPSDATIYYTLDGSEPTANSNLYSKPFSINGDVTLKAKAVRDGWYDSDVLTAHYRMSQSQILSYYPNDNEPMFNYAIAAPHLLLSGPVQKSNNFRRIKLTDQNDNAIAGEAFITLSMIAFVPDKALADASKYTLDIPRDAVKTDNGEVFKGFKWTFTTPDKASVVAMQGDESVLLLSENGSLKMRGMEYLTFNRNDGSFTYKDHAVLDNFKNGISAVSAGYTHTLALADAKIISTGMDFCGETGGSATLSVKPSVIKAGFQTSAIIGEDHSLWMCGRNDFCQLGDSSGTTARQFIKVAENVRDVALGNGFTLFVDKDNVLWAVGRNHRGQLGDGSLNDRRIPVKIMEGVDEVYASCSGYFAACKTFSDELFTWGDNNCGQLGRDGDNKKPGKVMGKITAASLGDAHACAVDMEYNLYAWGSNSHGQIGSGVTTSSKPVVMAKNVKAVAAGPHTTLVLYNSCMLSGWGLITHNNFGNADGKADNMLIDKGLDYGAIKGVLMSHEKLQVLPESKFALVATPVPMCGDYDEYEWSSDRPDIASVDGNGIVNANKLGNATITVKLKDRYGKIHTAKSLLEVTENAFNGVDDVRIDANAWEVYVEGHTIFLGNTLPGYTYNLYNLQGVLVGAQKAFGNTLEFEVSQPGVYVVNSGNHSVKAIVLP